MEKYRRLREERIQPSCDLDPILSYDEQYDEDYPEIMEDEFCTCCLDEDEVGWIDGAEKTRRTYRRLMRKQKREKRIEIISRDEYNPTAGRVSRGSGGERPDRVFIKYPKNSKRQKQLKRYSNKIARRKDIPCKGNGYRKWLDYCWKLY